MKNLGRNWNRGGRGSKIASDDQIPAKYHNLVYHVNDGIEMTGGSLRPAGDNFRPSNKEEEFIVAPPEADWAPVNKPSGSKRH